MGGFSHARADRGGYMSVRSVLYLLVGLLLGGNWALSHASQLALSLPSNVSGSTGAFKTAGSAAFNAASFNSAMTSSVAGRAVTVPASWRLASNAGQFAVAAIRLNPVGLVGSAVAAYLLTKGIAWAVDHWTYGQIETIPTITVYVTNWASGTYSSATAAGNAGCAGQRAYVGAGGQAACQSLLSVTNGTFYGVTNRAPSGEAIGTVTAEQGCPLNYTLNGGHCVGSAQPVGDAAWDAVGQSLPDAAASELAGKAVPLPLQDPVVSPTPIDIPLSDPYIDPVTGKRYKDIARVTPQPSTPQVADVQVVKQEVDAAGNPAVDPNTQQPKAPEDVSDLCKKNPDILACQKLDKPTEPETQSTDKTFSITPESGFGPDSGSCPADKSLTLRNGSITIDYQPVCSLASQFRPVLIAFAWLTALLIAVGIPQRFGQ